MTAKERQQIETQKREIQHLNDTVEDLQGKLKQCEAADKDNAECTKSLDSGNAELKTGVEDLNTKLIEKDKTLADLMVVNNQNRARIEAQDLTAKHNDALAKLKTVEDKLNTKVSVVVIGLLPWIQRDSPCRLDFYSFYTLTEHRVPAQDGHH